jgi:nucleoid-associated protein YgaU
MITGIDVSRWQGIINWPIAARNVDFAIIKIGGSDVGFYPDGQAVRNALEARAAKVPTAFYVYLGGASATKDEIAHIKNLVNNIGGLRPGEFICLDWEENHPNEVQYVYEIAKGLVDAGFAPPMIYMNLSYVKRANWKPLVDLNCSLWVAAWGDNDAVPEAHEVPGSEEWPHWAVWQYSSTGTVPGISGRVDMNQFNGTVEQFKKHGSGRSITMPAPVNTSRVVYPQASGEYSVVKGDNLSVIAARYGRSWQELWDMNRDRVSNPNKIFPGLKLRVWGATPGAQQAAKPADNTRYHTVSAGENLSSIAAKYGLPSYVILWEANKGQIPDPNLIRPGQKLRIP